MYIREERRRNRETREKERQNRNTDKQERHRDREKTEYKTDRKTYTREYKMGKYQCSVDPLFDSFGISCMTMDNFLFIFKTDSFKPVKQEVKSTVILPPLVFPA
jgi:hypothetical protein